MMNMEINPPPTNPPIINDRKKHTPFVSSVSVTIRFCDMSPDERKIHRTEYYRVNRERIRMLWNVHKEKYKNTCIRSRAMARTPAEIKEAKKLASLRATKWRRENPEKVKIIEQRYRDKHPRIAEDKIQWKANKFSKMTNIEVCMWGKRVAQQRRESYAKKMKKDGKPYTPQGARGPRFLQTPFFFGKSRTSCKPNPNYIRKKKVATDKKLKVSTFCKKTFIMRWD